MTTFHHALRRRFVFRSLAAWLAAGSMATAAAPAAAWRRRVPVDQLSVYVHAWAASQGVPTASVRAAYVYVDYPGGRVDELTAEGLLSIEQIQAALTVG